LKGREKISLACSIVQCAMGKINHYMRKVESKRLTGVVKFKELINLTSFLKIISGILFPWTCKVCGETKNVEQGFCDDCYFFLPWCKNVCSQCGLPLEGASKQNLICGHCLKKPPYFDSLHAALWYEGLIQQLITEFKYHQRWENIQCLVHLFVKSCPDATHNFLLIPMPSHPQRIRERGFNVVYEFTRQICKHLNIEYDLNVLARVKYTETQTGKTKIQRRQNIKNAFILKKQIINKDIILFDEVVTTGATINEASRILKKAGAKTIRIWCIARTSK
ncbi:MAG: ComF family protein, partial [Pseudomonadota bacterium]